MGINIKRKLDRPVSLYLNLTNACNSACVFCVSSSQNVSVSRNVPLDNIIEAYERLQIGRGDGVVVNGGEPTVYRDLVDLIARGAARGGQIYLCTNGRLLHRYDYARSLLTAGVSRLSIPLHGHDPKTHDTLTCRAGSLAQTLAGLKNAFALRAETGFPAEIELKLLALRSVLPEWPAIIDHIAQEFGNPDSLVLSGLNMWSTATATYDQVTPDFAELCRYLNAALDVAERHGMKLILWAIPLCAMDSEHCERFMSTVCLNSSGVRDNTQTIYFDPDYPDGIELPANEFNEAAAQFPCCDCSLLEQCGPGSTFMQQIIALAN